MKWGRTLGPGVLVFFLICTHAFGYTVTFEPRITVSEAFTDNVFLNAQDPQSDFITTVTPGFTAQLYARHGGAELSYDPGYAFYAEYNENNNWRDNATFRAWAELAEGSLLEISDNFLRTEDPLAWEDIQFLREEAETIGEAPTVRQGRDPYVRNLANITFTHDFNDHDSLETGYVYRLLNNSNPDIVNNQSHNPFFGLSYWPSMRFGIEPYVAYMNATYEDDVGNFDNWLGAIRFIYRFNPHLEGFFQYAHTARDYDAQFGEFEDFHVYDPSVGISWQFSPAFNVNGWTGYFLQNNDDSKDLGGYYVGGDLGWEGDRKEVTFLASNGYERADLGTERLGLTRFTRVRLTGSYDLMEHLSGNAYVYYRENEYVQTLDDQKDRYYGGGISAEYQLLKWMYVSLEYGYSRVESTIETNDYSENRGILRVTLAPDEPWRWIF